MRLSRFAAALVGLGLIVAVMPPTAAMADPGDGYRHSSGLMVLPSRLNEKRVPLSAATAALLGEARDLTNAAPADFGYPWVDNTGKVVVNIATPRGAARFADWRPSANAARGTRDVPVSAQRFEQLRDDIAAQISSHAPGFDHIVIVKPDGANNRLVLSVNAIDDASLAVLAKRYGTDLVAVRYEPGLQRPHTTAGRFNDQSPGGFYAGSAIRVTHNDPHSHICSTAFSWRSLDSTISYMLTAGHCASIGGTVYTAGAAPTYPVVEQMGSVTANTRENWNDTTGTTHLSGDLASASAYRGDIALIQVMSGKTSSGNVYADPGAYSRHVREFTNAWSVEGQRFCTDGITTREMCNWEVYDVGVDITYSTGAVMRGGNTADKQGQCILGGDSGGPIYTVRSDGGAAAKGIISGGWGGGDDNWGGLFDFCWVSYTDVRDPWLGLPGTVRLG